MGGGGKLYEILNTPQYLRFWLYKYVDIEKTNEYSGIWTAWACCSIRLVTIDQHYISSCLGGLAE